jgi:tetratricopeptide (TPR) repeat protein
MFRSHIRRVCSRCLVGLVVLSAIGLFSLATAAQDASPTPADPVELFNQAQDQHAKGNFQKAIDLYDQALKLEPDLAEAEFQKGSALLALGRTADAETSFRRAVGIRNEWTLAMSALGTLLERRGEFAEAEKLLNRAVAIDGNSFPAYAGLVELRLRTNASPDILKQLLEKVRIFSSKAAVPASVFATQATLEDALGDRVAAKISIARALELEPENKAALYEKANVALVENDLVLADGVIKTIESVDAGNQSAVALRARHLLASGKIDDARKLLGGVTSPSPETAKLSAQIELAAEQSPDALEKALANDPKNPLILGKLCSAYRATAPERALDRCKRALDVDPTNIDHAIGLGAALLQAKRYDDAITVLKPLSIASPENATIHANLGTAYFQEKRFAEAKVEYQWLTAHRPTPAIAYYFLAICHDQLGEYMDAAANYDLFLKNADSDRNELEIDKVKLRLPILDKQIRQHGGKNKKNGDR